MLMIGKRAYVAVLLVISGLALILPPAHAQLGGLVVTMTAPASGSTVSGSVPVSASVSTVGSLIVEGVQFQLDGANLGAEDASAPYAISWNTIGASNGTHALTAVARDAFGVRYTSNSVTVTVSNAPPDTTPPTVGITSPVNGATVSGTIAITANASDNVGVVGVQFMLDGGNLGAEDLSAPYSTPWNTTAVANGPHTLTAMARDAAGNRTTSSPVTVTVSNDTAPNTAPPPKQVKRFEETDPSVTSSAGWSLDSSRSWSGGTAGVSTTPGARATFTFSGHSVSWIGGR